MKNLLALKNMHDSPGNVPAQILLEFMEVRQQHGGTCPVASPVQKFVAGIGALMPFSTKGADLHMYSFVCVHLLLPLM